MVPLAVVLGGSLAARAVGAAGVGRLDGWTPAVRVGLAAMLVVTASAHFASRRRDLIRMVPPSLPNPAALVTVTGVTEIVIAFGLLIDATAAAAAGALVVFLVVVFPANVHAARSGVGIGGRPPTPLVMRAVMQLVFAAAAVVAMA